MRMSNALHGFLLALTTALFWGTLPIALKQITGRIEPLTIVWLRFAVAALWLWITLPGPRLPPFHDWSEDGRLVLLFLLAAFFLGANFVLYNTSVGYLSAPATQIISQAGPLLLMAGSIVFLREPLHRVQAWGGVLLTGGLVLFFNDKLHELLHFEGPYLTGLAIGLLGAFVWGVYGVLQKILLRECSSASSLRIIYTGVALSLTPFAVPSQLIGLSLPQYLCLAFCALNTIVAYGCFGKAMSLWHTAGVGAILSLTPLFTLACTCLAHVVAPGFFPFVPLNAASWAGAFIVVAGARLMSAGAHIFRKRG